MWGEYVDTVHDQLRAALWEAQAQSMAEAQWQKQYYDWKIGTVDLKCGDLVLVKADAFKGKGKIWDRWEDEACEVVHQIVTDVPSYKVTDQCRQSCILHQNQLLLIVPEVGIPLHVGVHHAWDRCTSPTSVKQDYTMRAWWSGGHPMPDQQDFPGVNQWEVMNSTMDIHQSIHWWWVKTSGIV